jgi:hypothetical protein
VLALHDYYLDRAVFSAATAHTATPENPDNPPTGSKPSPELTHDPEDDWCLQYLTVFHVPAIMEAFDDDASGYVKIKEVNEFTDEIPEDWNLLQWLAYWGAGNNLHFNLAVQTNLFIPILGWKVEITKYSCRILKVLSKMVEIQRNSLSANNDDIIGYLHKKCLGHAKCLTHLASEDTSVDEGLLKLVNSRMETDIEEWTGILEEGKYEIDSADTFTQLSGGRRVESVSDNLDSRSHSITVEHVSSAVCISSALRSPSASPTARETGAVPHPEYRRMGNGCMECVLCDGCRILSKDTIGR